MPWTITARGFRPILRIPRFEVRMISYFLIQMCFQNGPQQAARVVGYQRFPFLNQFDPDAAATIVAFCDAAIHFAQTNVEVHKATRIITDCISPAARLGLNIFCRGRRIPTLCKYPSDMSFAFDDTNSEIWKTVQDFEIKFLQDLRSAVSVDSYEPSSRLLPQSLCTPCLELCSLLPSYHPMLLG